ncbi:peptidase, partial [Candidatus Bipolaricaulota bacterium]|nr:peptidase [Candidatus Bipolaricaulota bacterium]
MFDKTRNSLEKLGLPKGDLYELTTSGQTFPDGAHFRMEVPTVNSIEAFQALIERADELGIVINRIDETYGIFRHTLEELRAYTALAKERGVALNLSVGPRATYDTGATVQTPQGVRIGYRLRGMEQVVRAIEDVKRAVSAGCRGILVYDEGLLWTLSELRKAGDLPKDIQFKLSAHYG